MLLVSAVRVRLVLALTEHHADVATVRRARAAKRVRVTSGRRRGRFEQTAMADVRASRVVASTVLSVVAPKDGRRAAGRAAKAARRAVHRVVRAVRRVVGRVTRDVRRVVLRVVKGVTLRRVAIDRAAAWANAQVDSVEVVDATTSMRASAHAPRVVISMGLAVGRRGAAMMVATAAMTAELRAPALAAMKASAAKAAAARRVVAVGSRLRVA